MLCTEHNLMILTLDTLNLKKPHQNWNTTKKSNKPTLVIVDDVSLNFKLSAPEKGMILCS